MQSQQDLINIIRWKDQEIENLKLEQEILKQQAQLVQSQADCQMKAAKNIQQNRGEMKFLELKNENTQLKQQVQQLELKISTLQWEYQQSNKELKEIKQLFNQSQYGSIQQSQPILF